MTAMPSLDCDRKQLFDSIDKLFHYLFVYVKYNTRVIVASDDGEDIYYEKTFKVPQTISISPTLYTRLDGCFGAGNCCRVPFDLVYTGYDRQRIVDYDHDSAVRTYGSDAAKGFKDFSARLLDRLTRLAVQVTVDYGFVGKSYSTEIYVQVNAGINPISGTKSCPYLVLGEDRYFCGVHPFKPLHCWMPHMSVRSTGDVDAERHVVIGRMQYGRNHNFGCPVIFEKSTRDPGGLFDSHGQDGAYYFDKQFIDDIEKLKWVSESAKSLGCDIGDNFAVDLHEALSSKSTVIRHLLSRSQYEHIPLWVNNDENSARSR